jgi:hypothetical protein
MEHKCVFANFAIKIFPSRWMIITALIKPARVKMDYCWQHKEKSKEKYLPAAAAGMSEKTPLV